jgi:hypothetical protein
MTGITQTMEVKKRYPYTEEQVDFTGVPMDSPIRELAKKLTVDSHSYSQMPEGSIMDYEQICHHDSAYLCEHRLQYIVNFLNEKMTKK